MNNVSEVVSTGFCIGCGTCFALCPNNAIRMEFNKNEGIISPNISVERCNFCGICIRVCPHVSLDSNCITEKSATEDGISCLVGDTTRAYSGYASDEVVRINSASGGLVTQLLIHALENGQIQGALVTKMDDSNPLMPKPFIARTKQDLIEASKSKYCPVPLNIGLKEIMDSKTDERFAVVGLPCHISGIRKAEKINQNLKEKIVIHIGLFCGHAPNFFATEYVLKNLHIPKNDIQKIDYRGDGWPGSMRIILKDGKSCKINYGKYWGSGFGSLFYPFSCTLCYDASAELSDLSFADAWLSKYFNHDVMGTSFVLVRNMSGESFLNGAVRDHAICLSEVPVTDVIHSQMGPLKFKKMYVFGRICALRVLNRSLPAHITAAKTRGSFIFTIKGLIFYLKINLGKIKPLWKVLWLVYLAFTNVFILKRKVLSFLNLTNK